MATQIVARLRKSFAVELPLRTLIERPTISEIASEIERLKAAPDAGSVPPITRARREPIRLHPQPSNGMQGPARTQPSELLNPSAAPLEFSIFFFSADGAAAGGPRYRLLLEAARFADCHGFTGIWTPERHFHSFGGLYPNPSITSAALATITKHIRLRAGSVVLPLHNPVRVVEEWSVVDNLSDGRVDISFAPGWNIDDFLAFAPDSYPERKDVMFRNIELVRNLWKGQPVELSSGDAKMQRPLLPSPIQPALPIWITAAGNPETFRKAGAIGANVLTHLLGQSLDEIRAKIRIYREARASHGHTPGKVTLMVHCYIGDDPDSVKEIVRKPFCNYLRTAVDVLLKLAESLGRNLDFDNMTEDDQQAVLSHAFERYYDRSGLLGTPASCRKMAEDIRAAGVDEIACLIDFGIDEDLVLRGLNRVGELKDSFNQATLQEAAHAAS